MPSAAIASIRHAVQWDRSGTFGMELGLWGKRRPRPVEAIVKATEISPLSLYPHDRNHRPVSAVDLNRTSKSMKAIRFAHS